MNLVKIKLLELKMQCFSSMKTLDTLDSYSLVTWSGSQEDPSMVRKRNLGHKMCTSLQALSTVRDGVQAAMLKGHSVVTINVRQTQAFLCDTEGSYTVAMYRLKPTLSFLKNF